MWTCKRCETLNEDERDLCTLCGEPKEVKAEQQRTSNSSQFTTDKRQFSQNQQSFGANNPQKDPEPRKKNHIAILTGVLSILLLAAVIAIVVLVSKQSVYQSVAQVTEPPAGPMEAIAPQADTNQTAQIHVNEDHRIVVDSIIDPALGDYFRWGAVIDQSGTVWIWNQNDDTAHRCDLSGAAAIYTNGMDGVARLFVVKDDGSVWWTKLDWENQTPQYKFEEIPGLKNIVDLEILDDFELGLFALDVQGQIWVYGNGKYGVFAMGQDGNYLTTPEAIDGIPPMQKIQCVYSDCEFGFGMVVAQATSGEFYYWGMNLFESGSKEYTNTPKSIDFNTTSPNWSLFQTDTSARSACIAGLDEEGFLSIYENKLQLADYSEWGSFIYQHGGLWGLYLLKSGGSVYGYGSYVSGCPLTGTYDKESYPTIISELSDNKSIVAIAFGGWETTALYEDGRIGFWRQSKNNFFRITDVEFIQDEAGGDFKLEMNSTHDSVSENNSNGIQIGDVTLTVESTGDYLANLIPTDETCNRSDAYIGGMTYDANTVHVSIDDCRLINKDSIGVGTMLPDALIQLTNLDTQTTWERTQGSDPNNEPFTDLPSGKYQYTVSKAGYIPYTSPTFVLNYVSGADNEYVWASCSLVEEGSVFSKGFQIQITDLAGNPISSKKFNIITLSAFGSTLSPTASYSSMRLGDKIDENGIITSDVWAATNLFALKKGSVAIISFDDSLTWSQGKIGGQCILIRAN